MEENFCVERLGRTNERNGDLLPDVVMDADKMEILQLGDMVSREGGTDGAVTTRISAGWRMLKNLCGSGVSN